MYITKLKPPSRKRGLPMKTRPILYNGEMVRATLDDRKTNTRRVMKPQPIHEPGIWTHPKMTGDHDIWVDPESMALDILESDNVLCPYGVPGDRLWVRETHTFVADSLQTQAGVVYRADSHIEWIKGDAPQLNGKTVYNVTKPDVWKWRPSIHMPRWASRITLEVTDVRVERVQDISERDAIAEGFDDARMFLEGEADLVPTQKELKCPLLVWRFHNLWDSINAKRSYGWDTNCWVWVVEFKRVEA